MRKSFMLASIVVLGLLVPAVADAQSKIAVVRPATVFQEAQETVQLKAKMESEGQVLKKTGDEKGANIRRLEGELSQLRRDSPSYVEKSRELRMARVEAETWGKLTAADLENVEKGRTLEMFKKIQAAIESVAKSKGIEVVISDVSGDLPETVDNVSKQQFTQFLSAKNLWYAAEAADITNEVLAKLDADFKAGGQ
ncbi:MAG TPA: OmpH family outer membrane protein [Tepidisphaeraceae bacterium]|jgi:Skp family chaperone for outer membrane proteins|nr:OmpH family outer membrane protein [Tepidisphaeraceae bacterium]